MAHGLLTAVFVNPAHPLPSPCNIRIRGVAPGASLVGLKVYSQLGYGTTSSLIQAMEYVVVEDDVDVINESFGFYFLPDFDKDPITLANDAAVAAGVTVTVSTGDAGSAATLEAPPPAPGSSRWARARSSVNTPRRARGPRRWPAASSATTSRRPAPVASRRVAPGEAGWALCSTNSALLGDCGNYNNGPAPIQTFGGTSEALR